MYNESFVYELSFVSPTGGTKPQLVFTFEERHFALLVDRFAKIASRIDEEAYLYRAAEFAMPLPDLFGNKQFGYGRCGFVQHAGESVQLCIELSQKQLYEITLTLHALTAVFLVPFEEGAKRANRTQQIDLETSCMRNRPAGYGHAVGGYVSSEVLEWLRKYAEANDTGNKFDHYLPLPEEVNEAMRQAYNAVSPSHLQQWSRECDSRVAKDGRFILACSGNACDVAIYPESYYPEDGRGARFSCHNLDSAFQQVTLIAGLAKLCELARKQNEQKI